MSLTSLTKHFRMEDIFSLMKRNPELTKIATISAALLLTRSIAALIRKRVPRHTILEIDLDDKYREHPQAFQIFDKHHTVHELCDTIEYAKTDNKVSAILVRLKHNFELPFAQLQEIRACVERFKLVGKLAVIYSESFGEGQPSLRHYYLASAFNLIYIHQSGAIFLAGSAIDVPFVRNTLNKLDIVPEISQRKLYKSIANIFNEEKLTPEHREMMESIVEEYSDQMIAAIAEGRRLSPEVVRTKILKGAQFATDALDGLVDGARYQDEVYKSVLDQLKITQSKANFLFWHKYRAKRGGKYAKKNKNLIALIYATGSIHRGASQSGEFGGTPSIGSDTLCAAIRTAVKDKKVKVILLRVDSPGGSYIASDTVTGLAAKNAGKKVVVSMGNLAASGGYFIAMPADHIVAEPGTLTGSIGVVYGKLVTRGLMEKLGVTHDQVLRKFPEDDGSGVYLKGMRKEGEKWGRAEEKREEEDSRGKGRVQKERRVINTFLMLGTYNDFYSPLHSYSEGREYIRRREEEMDLIYDDFTKKVAFSRKLNREQVEAVAQGRVWTGRQALERGLVDQLGGLEEAIQAAKALANIPTTSTPFVQVYPKRSLFHLIKPPKNREEADLTVGASIGINKLFDSVSLMSTVSSFIHTYSPYLPSSVTSLAASLLTPPSGHLSAPTDLLNNL